MNYARYFDFEFMKVFKLIYEFKKSTRRVKSKILFIK